MEDLIDKYNITQDVLDNFSKNINSDPWDIKIALRGLHYCSICMKTRDKFIKLYGTPKYIEEDE